MNLRGKSGAVALCATRVLRYSCGDIDDFLNVPTRLRMPVQPSDSEMLIVTCGSKALCRLDEST